jgi:hypothetical protein
MGNGSWEGGRPILPDIAPSTRDALRLVLICRRTECILPSRLAKCI